MKTITLVLTTLMLVACTTQEKEETIKTKETKKMTQTVKPKERSGEELFENACHYCHNYRIAIRKYGIPNLPIDTLVESMKRSKKGIHFRMGSMIRGDLKDVTQKEMQNIAEFIHKLNSGEAKMKPLPEVKPREVPKWLKEKKEEKRLKRIEELKKPSPFLQTLNRKTKSYKTFKKQKNRFVLNPCEISYNEKKLYFGMDIGEVRKILGKETLISDKAFNVEKLIHYWEDKGAMFFTWNEKVTYMKIYLEESIQYEHKATNSKAYKIKPNQSVIIFNGVLIKGMKMHEFLEKNLLTFEDFEFSYRNSISGYDLHHTCDNKTYFYNLWSRVPYVSDMPNFGRLSFGIEGEFTPEKSSKVKHISISMTDWNKSE